VTDNLCDACRSAIAAERQLREQWQEMNTRAVESARQSINLRLDEMNALRAQIANERGLYLSRDQFEREHSLLESRLRSLENQSSNLQGRLIVTGAVIALAVSLLMKFWK
jgi:hypothetical protein